MEAAISSKKKAEKGRGKKKSKKKPAKESIESKTLLQLASMLQQQNNEAERKDEEDHKELLALRARQKEEGEATAKKTARSRHAIAKDAHDQLSKIQDNYYEGCNADLTRKQERRHAREDKVLNAFSGVSRLLSQETQSPSDSSACTRTSSKLSSPESQLSQESELRGNALSFSSPEVSTRILSK